MARQAREKSQSGIYHVILKGIDARVIFLEDLDRVKFMKQLLKARERGDFGLIAYCLMDNHVHLLIEESKKESIGKSIQRITIGYVLWHNHKYGRCGHLFQNRFNSESVEQEQYFLTVVRYIHQNPVAAGIVKSPSDYEWSSYRQYIASYHNQISYIDKGRIIGYFDTQDKFEVFMNAVQQKECMEFEVRKRYTDEELRRLIYNQFSQVHFIEKMKNEDRNRLLKDIYRKTGASIRQIGRVLNMGRRIIENAIQ